MNYCDCCGDPIPDGIEIEWVEPLGSFSSLHLVVRMRNPTYQFDSQS